LLKNEKEMSEPKKLEVYSDNTYHHLTEEEHNRMISMLDELYEKRVKFRDGKAMDEFLKEMKRKDRAEKIKRIFE